MQEGRPATPGEAAALRARAVRSSALVLTLLCGLVVAGANLDRGLWFDELVTLTKTTSDVEGAAFWRMMMDEQHPLAHYGLVYLARQLGLENVVALRALNVLGVVAMLLALRFSYAREALTAAQAIAVAALFSSSPIFFAYLPELRGYFFGFAGSVAIACLWLTLVQPAALGRADLARWGLALALYLQVHYFAVPLGALLTLAALGLRAPHRDLRTGLALGLTSALAALPTLLMWRTQAHVTLRPGKMDHLMTDARAVLGVVLQTALDAAGRNPAAYVLCLLTALALLRGRRAWTACLPFVVLGGVAVAMYASFVMVSLLHPIISPRYLVVGAGAITVALAGLALGPGAPRHGLLLLTAVALVMQLRVHVLGLHAAPAWRTSATQVAAVVRSCPSARVFAALLVDPTRSPTDAPPIWRTGYRYYAEEQGFAFSELRRGDVVTPGARCPSVIWLEYVYKVAGLPVAELLRALRVGVHGSASVRYVGTGAVVLVR